MNLYLVRHGEAKRKEEDPERPLTDRGKKDVKKVAFFLAQSGLEVNQIRHSGKKRAEETALIIGDHITPSAGVRAVQGLAPNDDVVPLAEVLQFESESVMFVGHLPFVSRLASLLLTGHAERSVVRFQMGACVCLTKENGYWSLRWFVTPDLL